MFQRAQQLHQQMFRRMVTATGVVVTVRQPAIPDTADTTADKVLGRRTEVVPTPDTGREDEITGAWSTSYDSLLTAGASIPAAIAALGRTDKLDAVFRCELLPTLLDPKKPNARTLFDTALDVVYGGITYRVTGTDRTGLPGPSGPYILWVALKKLGGP